MFLLKDVYLGLWLRFNNLETSNAKTSIFSTRVNFLSPFILNYIIKISLQDIEIILSREINVNSHPSFKSFKSWQTYFFQQKSKLVPFHCSSHSELYKDKTVL